MPSTKNKRGDIETTGNSIVLNKGKSPTALDVTLTVTQPSENITLSLPVPTAPATTDVLVGRATTDTLLNKTLDSNILITAGETLNLTASGTLGIALNAGANDITIGGTDSTLVSGGNFEVKAGGSIDVTSAGTLNIGDTATTVTIGANATDVFIGGSGQTLTTQGDLVVTGDLTVQGNSTIINTSVLDVEDANITINKNGTLASAEGSGITVDSSGETIGSPWATAPAILLDTTKTSGWTINTGDDATGASEVLTADHSQDVFNKSLDNTNDLSITDSNFTLEGATANAQFSADALSAPGTFTLPAATDVLVGRISSDAGANRLQNKELSDNNVLFVDSDDTDKKLQFDLTPITTLNTRVFTPADGNMIVGGDTNDNDILTRANTQTITGAKTFSSFVQINAGADVTGNLDVGAGLDVTGNITVTGTVDGLDISTLGSTALGEGASQIGINDVGDIITATNVEGALQEIQTDLNTAESTLSAHVTDDASLKHDADEIEYQRLDGSKVDIEAASDNVELALTDLDDKKVGLTRLASNANGDGASLVGIEDLADIITATTVEGALAEIQTDLNAAESTLAGHIDAGASKHDADQIDVEAADGANHTNTDLETVIGQLDDALEARIKNSLIDAEGDLIVGDLDNTPARLPVGLDGQVLTANSAAGNGLGVEWSNAGGGGSGSGEINYVENPDDFAGSWGDSGANIVGTTEGATIPRDSTGSTAVKLTRSNTGTVEYGYNRFTVDDADLSKALKVQFDYLYQWTAGSVYIELYGYDDAGYSVNQTQYNLSNSVLPAADYSFYATWAAGSQKYMEIRFVFDASTSASDAITLSNLIVGPGTRTQGNPQVSKTVFTPVVYNNTGLSNTGSGSWARYNDQMNFTASITMAGDGTDIGALEIELPGGVSHNYGATNVKVGTATLFLEKNPSSDEIYTAQVLTSSTDATRLILVGVSPGTGFVAKTLNGTDFGSSTDRYRLVDVTCTLSIADWEGNTNIGTNYVEYPYNSDTTDADDTSSFAFGTAGVGFPTISGTTRVKRVQTVRNISAEDEIKLEVDLNGNDAWQAANNLFPWVEDGANEYGMKWEKFGANTINVSFGGNGANANETWATYGSAKWRMKVHSAGVPVTFGLATATTQGLVSDTTQTFGGDKTFADNVNVTGNVDVTGTMDVSGISTLGETTASLVYTSKSSQTIDPNSPSVSPFFTPTDTSSAWKLVVFGTDATSMIMNATAYVYRDSQALSTSNVFINQTSSNAGLIIEDDGTGAVQVRRNGDGLAGPRWLRMTITKIY